VYAAAAPAVWRCVSAAYSAAVPFEQLHRTHALRSMGRIVPQRNGRCLARLAGMSPRLGPRKYDPLVAYLAGLAVDEVTLTLPEIEQMIGQPLPAGASHPSFWTNRSPRLFGAQPWMQAGWRMVRTDLHARPPAVTFVRVTVPPRSPAR
jgi:hypothetical protein